MTTETHDEADAAIWSDGALTTREALVFVQRDRKAFYLLAKRHGWPRRYRHRDALWPKRILMQYLASLPTVRGQQGAST